MASAARLMAASGQKTGLPPLPCSFVLLTAWRFGRAGSPMERFQPIRSVDGWLHRLRSAGGRLSRQRSTSAMFSTTLMILYRSWAMTEPKPVSCRKAAVGLIVGTPDRRVAFRFGHRDGAASDQSAAHRNPIIVCSGLARLYARPCLTASLNEIVPHQPTP
jgi:hypothetical protein